MNPFLKPAEHYKRRWQLLRDYVNDAACFLTQRTGRPLEESRAFVIESITKGKRQLTMPMARFLIKNKYGDREIQEIPFHQYLSRAVGNDEIIAPTLTTYLPTTVRESLLGVYINNNVKRRSVAKKAMFQAEMDNNKTLQDMYKSQQTTFKIKNNALSGAHCSPFTPLWNKTIHSTLTSICRSATSYANANNEKFLCGNRHYYSPMIVETNIISIINHVDKEAIHRMMGRYNLHVPSNEEIMEAIAFSTRHYWNSEEAMEPIRALVETLSPWQRCAFLYVSDFYHLAKYNEGFARTFLDRLSLKATESISNLDECDAILKKMDDNMKAFVSILCATELRFKDIKSVRERPYDYGIIASTAKQKYEVIADYAEFIETFWATDNLPSSVFAVPSIVRRGVLTSDTDSTIFTVQSWVKWHRGSLDFDDGCTATANAMVYLVSQVVSNILAVFSGNMGVEEKFMFQLEMKNEFYFPVFSLTSRAKHYYAYRAVQEGVMKRELEDEIKGVALRSSAVATDIIKLSQQTMRDIMNTVMRGDMISLRYLVRKVATIEREVLEEMLKGSFKYYRKTRIQDASAYKNENSNFLFYSLWQEAFAPKYGPAPEPPYNAIAASLTTGKRPAFLKWLETMEDQVMASRIRDWATRNNKQYIGTIYMPQINLLARGVPLEIASIVDHRTLVAQLMESFYLVLEGVGIFARNKKITRLLSDDPTILSLPERILYPNPSSPVPHVA